ncbi:MBL fold metallo-hydrolase [Silvimonas sp. JCM 19000]
MNLEPFPSQHIGDYTLTALSDGYLPAPLTLLSNIDPDTATQLHLAAGMTDPAAIHINSYLLRGRGRTVLIDAGAGGYKQWGGDLQANLARAGVLASEVDTVLLTHAHPDHIGGLLDASGALAFPHAALRVHQDELAFWLDDAHLARANERAQGNFLLARKVFAQYHAQTQPFAAGEVLPGISAVALPGHTAGHSGFRVDGAARSVLVWGDIVHFPQIQIARPEVSIAFDLDPLQAAGTRARLLDRVSADRLLIAGMHLGELGFGYIERVGKTYQLAYAN